MGNQFSTSSKRRGSRKPQTAAEQAAELSKRVVGDLQEGIKNSVKRLDDDHPAAQLIDHMCGTTYYHDDKYRNSRSASYYSEEVSEDGSRTFQSEDDTTYDGRRGRKSDKSVDSQSYYTQSDYDSDSRRRGRGSFDTEDESRVTHETEQKLISKPLASSFAKRCYFTKSGIGKTTQHYEGLTLTGNVVLMLASAMKLKGCPTICDEDLRRVEQTYPNQFSRLPDELLLSSGWRRISKYCHFSNKSIPDGIPFFHSKQRLHPSGGYYFLLAASVGMIRPIDAEPLSKDTLVLLETDFPNQCDAAPSVLISDPLQWVLVNKFCFFSGGPINTEEDVYYQADFDGNPIYMLAFLSPSLTPEELYKLTEGGPENEPGLKSVADVQEVESVYDLTERDFDDLKLYHLGPCRALPQYILQPSAWTKVLPPHFLAARQQAMLRAHDYDGRFDDELAQNSVPVSESTSIKTENGQLSVVDPKGSGFDKDPISQEEAEQEGAFHSNFTIDRTKQEFVTEGESDPIYTPRADPPDDEPPSLKIESMEENENLSLNFDARDQNHVLSSKHDIDDQGFFRMEPAPGGNKIHAVNAQNLVSPRTPTVLRDEKLQYSDEKKVGIDVSTNDQPYNDIEPIGTSHSRKSDYNSSLSQHPSSPNVSTNSSIDSRGHQSPAMRGAHEILKRNRRRRAEGNKIGDETSTDITGSAVSGSSVLSENSGPSDRSSRRALILQMAKARMKNNRESPNKGSSAVTEEDEANDTVFTDGNSLLTAQDIDLTSDLD